MTNKDIQKIRQIVRLKNENSMRKQFNFMLFAICIFLIFLLTQSCKSHRHIVGTSSQNTTNTSVTTLIKDTVIYVQLPVQPPVTAVIPLQDTLCSDTAFAENATAKAFSFIQNGKLNLVLQAKDTAIFVHVPNAIRQTTTTHNTKSEVATITRQKAKKRFGSTAVERVLILVGLIFLIIFGISITQKRILR